MDYEETRRTYRPTHIKGLLIAESPPPAPEFVASSRQFYRTDKFYTDDRLYANTIKALFPETNDTTNAELEKEKLLWLKKFQAEGWYIIEALQDSQEHEVTKKQRRELIRANLHSLIERVGKLADPDTKIILIKSNVFDIAAEPLRQAGFVVLNTELLDYPGRFNQHAYREKLSKLATKV